MIAAIRARVSSWRYESSPDARSRRDLRIDLLRGFCVFVMTIDHIGGETSWLYVLTGGDRFVVSAAEGFVLLSGFAMGMVYDRVIAKGGLRAMVGKVLGRTWVLYVATVLLTILFASASTALGTPWADDATPAKSRVDFAFSVLTFHRTYSLVDVLVLYTLLVLTAGPTLALLARGFTLPVLVASWTAWFVAQVWLERLPRAWSITDGGFPFAAWQALFVTGLVLGFNRQRLARYFQPALLLTFAAAATVALVVVQIVAIRMYSSGLGSVQLYELLYDKNALHVGRVLALFSFAAFLFAVVTVLWAPLRRWTGWLLLTMGARALYAYVVQLFVVAFFSSELIAPVRLDRENALFQAAGVVLVWLACLAAPAVSERWQRFTSRWSPAPAGSAT